MNSIFKKLWTIWKKWKTAFKKMDKKLFHGPTRKASQQTKHCFHWTLRPEVLSGRLQNISFLLELRDLCVSCVWIKTAVKLYIVKLVLERFLSCHNSILPLKKKKGKSQRYNIKVKLLWFIYRTLPPKKGENTMSLFPFTFLI